MLGITGFTRTPGVHCCQHVLSRSTNPSTLPRSRRSEQLVILARASSNGRTNRFRPSNFAMELSDDEVAQAPATYISSDQQSNAVFSFNRWDVHKDTASRYRRHIFTLFNSQTWKNLENPLKVITGGAVAVCAYQSLQESGALPFWAPHLELSDGPLELTSFALSLLLVFRTDSSYARWNDALKVWSEVRSISKDIARSAVCWIKDPLLVGVLLRWTLTFSKSLKVYLRQGATIDGEVESLLLPHEKARLCETCVSTSVAYPAYTLHVLQQAVERARLSDIREETLLTSITRLNAAIGSCEKVLRYPIPLSYTRHTSRFMVIWLTLLPFSLWDEAGWLAVPITTVVAFLLLGIDEIGVQIEEPFSLLPLDDIVKDIEKDLFSIYESRGDVNAMIDLSLNPEVANPACPFAGTTGASPAGPTVQIDVEQMLAALSSFSSSESDIEFSFDGKSKVSDGAAGSLAEVPAAAAAAAVSHGSQKKEEQPATEQKEAQRDPVGARSQDVVSMPLGAHANGNGSGSANGGSNGSRALSGNGRKML